MNTITSNNITIFVAKKIFEKYLKKVLTFEFLGSIIIITLWKTGLLKKHIEK